MDLLAEFSEMSENLYILNGGVGVGSCVKMVNQLLAGVHIAASAEAIALGARLGLETRSLYEYITESDGNSWYISHPSLQLVFTLFILGGCV
jgi:3-hydroxyisobutyrate dehydrogenase-like beta-hydroxyacid dehydrogenase